MTFDPGIIGRTSAPGPESLQRFPFIYVTELDLNRPLLCSGPVVSLAASGGVFLLSSMTMWKLDGTRGALDNSDLSAALEIAQPFRGLSVSSVSRNGFPSAIARNQILQVHFPEEPQAKDVQDSWVRGGDLVVTYAQHQNRQVTAEIYWRLVRACASTVGMELILSVQTDLLDATATTHAASQMTADEVLWLSDPTNPRSAEQLNFARQPIELDRAAGQGVFLFRSANSPMSYVDMVHPTDFSAATIRRDSDSTTVEWQLFPESLEKGVIRRARLRGLFVERQNDLHSAANCFQEFINSPLPLTT